MSAEYLIEHLLQPGEPGYTEQPRVSTVRGIVHFPKNPLYGGRRVLIVDTHEQQQELLRNGNIGVRSGGKSVVAVPTDLVGVQERQRIRGVVEEVLREHGLLKGNGQTKAAPVPVGERPSEENCTLGALQLAKKLGLDLRPIVGKGSGEGGRVTKEDVEALASR